MCAWVFWNALPCFAVKALQFDDVNLRDKRTIGEQIKSGFRLAGWILLTLAFICLVLVSTAFLAGKGNHTQPTYRLLGLCGLLATATAMFITVRRWAKWFVGVLGYMILKLAVSLLLGRTPSVPSVTRPRLVFLEFLVVLVFALLLCARYLTHTPRTVETVGLVGLVIALSFSVIYDSSLPIVAGVAVLGIIQLTDGRRPARIRSLN
jgi:hypothetical protein